MKLNKVVSQDFKTVLEKLSKAEVPMRAAFKLRGIVKQVNEEINKYEDIRISTLKKYGNLKENGDLVTDENGQVIFKDDQSRKDYFKELAELLLVDVKIEKINMDELGSKVNMSAIEVMQIEDLLE